MPAASSALFLGTAALPRRRASLLARAALSTAPRRPANQSAASSAAPVISPGLPAVSTSLPHISPAIPADSLEEAQPRFDRHTEAAVEAVRLASSLCQAIQLELTINEHYEKDGDASPVTVADYGAQVLVAWSLQRSFPGERISLMAEEDAADLRAAEGAGVLARVTHLVNEILSALPGSPQVSSEEVLDLIDCGRSDGGPVGRHWVLDPIDGTKGFVSMRQYAVCLGMLQDGQVVVGVLGCPNLPHAAVEDEDCIDVAERSFDEDVGVIFAAQRGRGTYAGPLKERGMPSQRVHVKDGLPADEVRFMEAYERRHSNHSLSQGIAEELGLSLPSLRMDSQAKYGALSRGDASFFIALRPVTYREKVWDHVAGAIVVEEAGGKITDTTGKPLDFSQGRHLPLSLPQPGIVAATPSVHAAVIKAIQRQLAAAA